MNETHENAVPPPPAALFDALEKNRQRHPHLMRMFELLARPAEADAVGTPSQLSADEIARLDAVAAKLDSEQIAASAIAVTVDAGAPAEEIEVPVSMRSIALVGAPDGEPVAEMAGDAWAALGDALTGFEVVSETPAPARLDLTAGRDLDASELFVLRPRDERAERKRAPEVRARRAKLAPYVKGITAACAALCVIGLLRVALGGSAEDIASASPARGPRVALSMREAKETSTLLRASGPATSFASKAQKSRRR